MRTFPILALAAALAQAPQVSPRPAAPAAGSALQMQVMLDRAGFSPGVIDGQMGNNTRKARAAHEKSGNDAGATSPGEQPLTTYTITPEDAAGPFIERMPTDMMEMANLPALGYTSLVEAIAERFHTTPAFLQRLNPGVQFAAGQQIQVPNVQPMAIPQGKQPAEPSGKADVVLTVSKTTSAAEVADASGKVVFYAPVTTGSEHDPLPIGEWKVNGVQLNPTFRYNPDLFWDADPSHTKATIPPGPNNPVGLVWIDLSKPHYGLHGTPEPSTIGRTQSHGCVRLTNWDALRLAALVKPGTRVVFKE